MGLYERTYKTFICEECNDREIDVYEYKHHQDHHARKCQCAMLEHRLVPEWLKTRNIKAKEIVRS